MHQTGTIYTIDPHLSFADTLTRGLLGEIGYFDNKDPSGLADILILLPTRRACRVVRDSFLRHSEGRPLLLPRLQPIGDIDEEELFLNQFHHIAGENTPSMNDIPPSISTIERQVTLVKLIEQVNQFQSTAAHNFSLANALGRLLDQIYTENLDMTALPDLVDKHQFADHWGVTLTFLEIISKAWPAILSEKGYIDAADRRNRLLFHLVSQWETTPPKHPIIAAGTTGSIPATTALLKTIMNLPKGRIILPGVNTQMSDDVWDEIDDTHPQATLKNLIENLDIERAKIQRFGTDSPQSNKDALKVDFIQTALMPASKTDKWQEPIISEDNKNKLKQTLSNTHLYECDTAQDEAELISLMMRESVEIPEKITAVITPDRNLAKRITNACRRWGLEIDDTAGQPLSQTTTGHFIMGAGYALQSGLSPIHLLGFLKHPYQNHEFTNFRKAVRLLDKQVLRGLKPQFGIEGLIHKHQQVCADPHQKDPDAIALELIGYLDALFQPALALFSKNEKQPFGNLLKAHIALIENCADMNLLWRNDQGEEAAGLLSDLFTESDAFPLVTVNDYIEILKDFMDQKTIRPKYGTHPRLMILGQLEARLIHADRIILAGLNEGTWPQNTGYDPWMSRPMRAQFGLPPLERGIGLSAHDFVHGFCKNEVFMTRSKRNDGAPTVASRWLLRIKTYLKKSGLDEDLLQRDTYFQYQHYLNKPENITPISRPQPRPDVNKRPTALSVTAIDKWMKDPYQIYAQYILKLKPLEPFEKEWGAIEKGNLLHKILEVFNKKYNAILPDNFEKELSNIAVETFKDLGNDDAAPYWFTRFNKIIPWYKEHETNWRHFAAPVLFESKGSITLDNKGKNFMLSARVDRIDKIYTGGYAIIDYKSGGQYSLTGMKSGDLPQLPLEGYILENQGFTADIRDENPQSAYLGYWMINGGAPAGTITTFKKDKDLTEAIENAQDGINHLIDLFFDKDTPYYSIPNLDNAPRFNDYEHLARVKEWAALDENSEDAA